MFDVISYVMGHKKGENKGITEGEKHIEIENGITCTDDGNGNITITED